MKYKKTSKIKIKKTKVKIKWWYLLPTIIFVAAAGYFIVNSGFASRGVPRFKIYRQQTLNAQYFFPLNYTKGQLAYGNGQGIFWECINQRKGKSCELSHPYPAMDIFAPTGTEVVAAKGGVVTRTRSTGCTNNCSVFIKGDDGLYYLYTHLLPGSVFAQVGLKVKMGQYLGKIGTAEDAVNTATGKGTTPHLHFDIRKDPNAVCNRGNPTSPGCKSFIDPRPILFYGYDRLLWLPQWNF